MLKKLTGANWLETDTAWRSSVRLHADGTHEPLTSSEFVEPLLAVRLSGNVPNDVRNLFEVARGAMVYGWFFYPLLTLGAAQTFRVAEVAVTHKCQRFGYSGRRTFERRLKWLAGQDVIGPAGQETWHAVRQLRNIASHPDSQQIFGLGMSVPTLQRCADLINTLFNS